MSPVTVRSYRPSDHSASRRLWSELTNQHNQMYGEPAEDGGEGFEEYLTRLDLSGLWVADHADDGVIGLVGMIIRGRAGVVEPVVVTISHRHKGVGRKLLRHVASDAQEEYDRADDLAGLAERGRHPQPARGRVRRGVVHRAHPRS